MVLARPLGDEIAYPYQAAYIAHVQGEVDPRRALEAQRDALLAQLRSVSGEQAAYRYGPDKWSVRQVVGHLADAERILAYRLLRIARGDETPLPGFDESAYVAAAALTPWPSRVSLRIGRRSAGRRSVWFGGSVSWRGTVAAPRTTERSALEPFCI